MIKKFVLLTFVIGTLLADEFPIEKAITHPFKKAINLNAQIVQLANAEQSVTSLIQGHLEQYFVKPSDYVRKGDKIASIKSIELSRMSANYLALKKELFSAQKNYSSIKKLFQAGLASMQQLNSEAIKKAKIEAKLSTLRSQLQTLGIDPKSLKKPTSTYILKAHTDGKVSALLKPLHATINPNEAVVTLVKTHGYFVKSFLPLDLALDVQIGDKVVAKYADKKIESHVTQILPKVDETTQRIVVLSSIDKNVKNLFIDLFVESTLYYGKAKNYVAVKKSALSFFNNEWVVFVPVDEHEESLKNSREEEHEIPFEPRVVKIITMDEEYAAVEGIKLGQEYVSDKSYYIKSMLLKSSLGEEGH